MIARAPGKVVLSGAYAVLDGAPAIVAAVNRYVTADSSRGADFVTPEVRAALGDRRAPWFDASALRSGDQKLGLGSSAAILVASLGALAAENPALATAAARATAGGSDGIGGTRAAAGARDDALQDEVLEPAIVAHRAAQGGGSGIDVAASVRGGTLVARRSGDGPTLDLRAVQLPGDLVVEVLFAGVSASTPELVGRVRRLKGDAPGEYDVFIRALTAAAGDAERAVDAGSAPALVLALRAQLEGLRALGARAGAGIVTAEVAHLAALAHSEGATVLPAGAGGGDVALFVGQGRPSPSLKSAFAGVHHVPLGLELGARGLHLG